VTGAAGEDYAVAGDELVARVRGLWGEVATAAFPADGVKVVCAPGSRVCPPGWVGSVTVGGAGLVTVPSEDLLGRVWAAVDQYGIDGLAGSLRVTDTLGPALLAYADADGFRPAHGPVEWLEPGDPDLRALLDAVDPAEARESGLEGNDSRLAVVRDAGRVVAAAGWQDWPAGTAHVGVLTATGHRGRGLAGQVAGAVTAAALERRLLPQWRARVVPSQRVARRLGYRTLGRQFSVHPA